MLKLDKLEIRGFKSFSDRTEVRIPSGVTAVVGPNGCGKSNIGDAINWVLGEQSAKMLRGQQMADVIFGGSRARKPLGMAEVSIVLGGADGLQHADNGRIKVTRRLFRSGESEYLLNGARARLKDIQELLRQGKVGARTYATIEQGRIDQVLNAKPKERRALIEDAAGISGYKHKRRLAELRLEATHANLLRVNDIVTEVQRQINSLKRQAAKARRYRRLRDELRERELIRFACQAREMDRELERLRRSEGSARDRETGASAGLSRLEAELAEMREALEKEGLAFREASERLHQADIEIDRAEAQIRTCRERIDESQETAERRRSEAGSITERLDGTAEAVRSHAVKLEDNRLECERLSEELTRQQETIEEAETGLQTLREEIEALRRRHFDSVAQGAELRNRRRSMEEALERNDRQRSRLESERSEVGSDLARLREEAARLGVDLESRREAVERHRTARADRESAMREARSRQAEALESLSSARESEQSAHARLATLQDLETRFAGVSDGVKSLLGAAAETGVRTHGVVADYVEASREVEGAAEGYLQWLLPTVIVEDDGDAHRAAELLRQVGAGRTSMICRTQPAGALAVGTPGNGHSDLPPEILDDERVLGRLRDGLTLKASMNGAVAERIGDAVLVDSLGTALELHRRHPSVDYLTRAGDVVYASGVIAAGGHRQGDHGLLAHNRRTDDAQRDHAEASTRASTLQASADVGGAEIVALESTLEQHRGALESEESRRVELELLLERASEAIERTARRVEVLDDELAGLVAETDPLHGELRQMVEKGRLAEDSQESLEHGLEQQTVLAEQRVAELRLLVERGTDLREERAARQQRQESLQEEATRLAGEEAELRARLQSLLADATGADERARANAELLERTERELVHRLEERKGLETEIGQMERSIAERREVVAGHEESLRTSRVELETARDGTREAELERTRAESARQHLDDLCRQELGIGAGEAVPPEGELPEDVDLESLDGEVERIKERIERIGPVNMTAIEEFAELEERYEFLTSQREDLNKSSESLKEAIRRINRECRQRFMDSFEKIRQSYQEIFKLLFTGGRADLRLEEGEDVLECGIEILAQPPGKRLSGVHLMSGGEKALSAIALLFAIFHYQPSPFCLLDEVDAALDDVNVGRFARMVREYAENTQFIVITHNKLSMEVADLLYGVTMEEPGVSKLVSLQLH